LKTRNRQANARQQDNHKINSRTHSKGHEDTNLISSLITQEDPTTHKRKESTRYLS